MQWYMIRDPKQTFTTGFLRIRKHNFIGGKMSLEWVTSFLTFFLGIGLGVLIQRYWLDKTSRAALLESELTKVRHEYLELVKRIENHRNESLELIKDFKSQSDRISEHFESLSIEEMHALPGPLTQKTNSSKEHRREMSEEAL